MPVRSGSESRQKRIQVPSTNRPFALCRRHSESPRAPAPVFFLAFTRRARGSHLQSPSYIGSTSLASPARPPSLLRRLLKAIGLYRTVVKSSVEPGSQLESYESKSVEHAPGHCVRRRIRTHWRRRVTIKTRRRCLRNAYSAASRRTSESTNTAGGRGGVGIQSGWTTSTEHSPALYIPISPYARTTALTRMASQKHPHPWCVHILSPNSSISAPASL
ncbi:hypothetical protein LXA43DRAFT_330236 [Ganoderma leucocontextum]|nr:hypothetical protein LXA43DRAFT_330236 [Ganoderma leucocontextum]